MLPSTFFPFYTILFFIVYTLLIFTTENLILELEILLPENEEYMEVKIVKSIDRITITEI